MKGDTILFQNKFCRIIGRDTFYILQSKLDRYNDQYFFTLPDALKAIGINSLKGHIPITE